MLLENLLVKMNIEINIIRAKMEDAGLSTMVRLKQQKYQTTGIRGYISQIIKLKIYIKFKNMIGKNLINQIKQNLKTHIDQIKKITKLKKNISRGKNN